MAGAVTATNFIQYDRDAASNPALAPKHWSSTMPATSTWRFEPG